MDQRPYSITPAEPLNHDPIALESASLDQRPHSIVPAEPPNAHDPNGWTSSSGCLNQAPHSGDDGDGGGDGGGDDGDHAATKGLKYTLFLPPV